MNDDFLHNLRRDPPREFATRLKSRLDRQRAGRLERRRPSLFRGFSLALLVGGAVSAIAAVSIYGVPSAVLDLLRVPPRAAQGLTANSARVASEGCPL